MTQHWQSSPHQHGILTPGVLFAVDLGREEVLLDAEVEAVVWIVDAGMMPICFEAVENRLGRFDVWD